MDALAKVDVPLAVAYSGGADSTALLIETAKQHPTRVMAFHVHHGLQAAADDFAAHCQSFCDQLGVPLHIAYVNAAAVRGESPEDAARGARYAALIDMAWAHGVANAGGKVLLAQHADDQVETVLLALSRGAGLGGLSAMPAQFVRGGVQFERPMLHRSAVDIRVKLKEQGIRFIEDPTNLDKAFTRNKLRLDVLPALQEAIPQYRETFARSVSHIAQANDLLTDLAKIDLALLGTPPRIQALQGLSNARQANSLRFWLKSEHQVMPSTAQLSELIKQIAACQTNGHHIELKVASGRVMRSHASLVFVAARLRGNDKS
ncbi:MAG: tRNA lysidine(34) synthetase TilS [Cytophagales bacterium]|nr:tRNA lysidine(34) synthetase TilS [Cytophagales bacterium]